MRSIDKLIKVIESRRGPGIIFVDHRSEAHELAPLLAQGLEYRVEWMTSERSKAQREELANQMRDGQLKLIVSTSAWSTGIDIPGLQFVMLTGASKAPIGVLQSAGRALRTADGKMGYEIINICEAGLERQAIQRGRVLSGAGFKTEEGFLDRLEEQYKERKQVSMGGRGQGGERQEGQEWTLTDTFFSICGPLWLWKIAGVVVAMHIGYYLITGEIPQ